MRAGLSVERNATGGYVVSEVIDGARVRRVYYLYTKREAVSNFVNEFPRRKRRAVV